LDSSNSDGLGLGLGLGSSGLGLGLGLGSCRTCYKSGITYYETFIVWNSIFVYIVELTAVLAFYIFGAFEYLCSVLTIFDTAHVVLSRFLC